MSVYTTILRNNTQNIIIVTVSQWCDDDFSSKCEQKYKAGNISWLNKVDAQKKQYETNKMYSIKSLSG